MFGKEKKIKFTCKRCKYVELRPFIKYPKPKSAGEIAGMKIQATGAQMSLFGGAAKGGYALAAQLAEQNRVDAQLRTVCPSCGSRKTKQEVVRA